MIEKKAFNKLSYGLFLVTSQLEGKDNGCIINTAVQCASDPLRISISVINANLTADYIRASKTFTLSTLPEGTPFKLFSDFGMVSGRDKDKFQDTSDIQRSENGMYYYAKANSVFDCKVVQEIELGSHVMFIAEVTDCKLLSEEASATYAYYHSNIKVKPEVKKSGWVCSVCGYVHEGDDLPEDFICPLCKHPASDFVRIEDKKEKIKPVTEEKKEGKENMAKFVCKVCGYVHEGEEAPESCPVCHAPKNMFEEVKGELKLAAEHKLGIYDKTVKNNPNISEEDKKYIYEQLVANFQGECSEVGMYLCMARIAHREGYPEIGLYWEKAAFEEAEHAAKFAELLGGDLEAHITESTEKNLAWRVDCEFGATAGKFDLALCAKKNGLDEIHDTVHEMARDEARHGKALKGLLDRYFK